MIDYDKLQYYNAYKLRVKSSSKNLKPVDKSMIDTYSGFFVCKSVFPFFEDNVLYAKNSSTDEHYIVYNDHDFSVYVPKDNSELLTFFQSFKVVLELLHNKRFVHFNINESIFLHRDSVFCFAEDAKFISFSNVLKKSPIIGSKIISPIHVLLEMLNSNVESTIIPYNDFKKKFVKFYNHISKDNILWTCQKYFSMKNGAVDYIDYIIDKLCIKDSKNNIEKNDSKVLLYIPFIDKFPFAIVLHSYQLKLNTSNPEIIDYIIDCVSFK